MIDGDDGVDGGNSNKRPEDQTDVASDSILKNVAALLKTS